MPLDIDRAIAEIGNKNKFKHDRSKTVGASEIGQCIRRVAMGKAGYEPDKGFVDSKGAAYRGDIVEDYWSVPLMRRMVENEGGELLWAGQENQRSLIVDQWKLSCTPDGLAVGMSPDILKPYGVKSVGEGVSQCFLTEFKSFDPRIDTNQFPKPEHLAQLQVQLGMINADKDTLWKPRWGAIVYVNCSWLDDIRIYADFHRDAEFYNLARRAMSVYSMPPESQLPEGAIAGEKECEYCPFRKRCKAIETAVPRKSSNKRSPFTSEQAERIRSAVGTIHNQRRQLNQFKKNKEEAEARLKQVMRETDTHNIKMQLKDGRYFTARWIKTAGRQTFDFAAMAEQLMEDGHDLEQFKTTGLPGQRLSVRVDDGTGKPDTKIADNFAESEEMLKPRSLRRKSKETVTVEVKKHD